MVAAVLKVRPPPASHKSEKVQSERLEKWRLIVNSPIHLEYIRLGEEHLERNKPQKQNKFSRFKPTTKVRRSNNGKRLVQIHFVDTGINTF